jgi:hypothetical protein
MKSRLDRDYRCVWRFVTAVILQVFAECSGTKVQIVIVLDRVWAVTASVGMLLHQLCHQQFCRMQEMYTYKSFKLYSAFKVGLQQSIIIELAKNCLVFIVIFLN